MEGALQASAHVARAQRGLRPLRMATTTPACQMRLLPVVGEREGCPALSNLRISGHWKRSAEDLAVIEAEHRDELQFRVARRPIV